jgi:hypothetical protein
MRFEYGGGGGSYVVFVDGKPVGQRPDLYANLREQRIGIKVHCGAEKAKFSIDVNGVKDFIAWEGPYAALGDIETSGWKTNMIQHVWIGSWDNKLTFHAARVRMLSGSVRRDLITEAATAEDQEKGLVRLVGLKPNASEAAFGQFRINQLPIEGAPGWVDREWPLISPKFKICDDYYAAAANSRITARIPPEAKSFSVVGYNCSSGTSKSLIVIDGVEVCNAGLNRIPRITVDIPEKSKIIELIFDIAGEPSYDRAHWCWPRFHSVAADQLTDAMLDGKPGSMKFTPVAATTIYGTVTHNEPMYRVKAVPIHFRDAVPCHEFIFAHAPSTVTYPVPRGMTRFTAVGYNMMSETTRFEVWVNGALRFQSPEAGMVPINVELPPGAKSIELKINAMGDPRDDRSLWCYPRLHRN